MRRPSWGSAVVLVAAAASVACAPRPRMCSAATDCERTSACVAGRCQVDKPTVRPAVDSARRIIARPVDVAYVKSGDGPSRGALPPIFHLGKDGGRLFLRFSTTVAPSTHIVEAYVVLHRAELLDDEGAPVSLHATRIVDSWVGGSVSWALQPRAVEMRLPSTAVRPDSTALVRVDVRDLVRQWPRHDPVDQGICVVAENETATGTTFAFSGIGIPAVPPDPVPPGRTTLSPSTPELEPYLELYLR